MIGDLTGSSNCSITPIKANFASYCYGYVKSGSLWLEVWKYADFSCSASCSGGPSSCYLDQDKDVMVTITVAGRPPGPPIENTNGFVLDGPIQCPSPYSKMTGNWSNRDWGLVGMDAPGYWQSSVNPPGPCNVGALSPDNTQFASYSNSISHLIAKMAFRTYCSCNEFSFPFSPRFEMISWDFNFDIYWFGTDADYSIWFGGDCP